MNRKNIAYLIYLLVLIAPTLNAMNDNSFFPENDKVLEEQFNETIAALSAQYLDWDRKDFCGMKQKSFPFGKSGKITLYVWKDPKIISQLHLHGVDTVWKDWTYEINTKTGGTKYNYSKIIIKDMNFDEADQVLASLKNTPVIAAVFACNVDSQIPRYSPTAIRYDGFKGTNTTLADGTKVPNFEIKGTFYGKLGTMENLHINVKDWSNHLELDLRKNPPLQPEYLQRILEESGTGMGRIRFLNELYPKELP